MTIQPASMIHREELTNALNRAYDGYFVPIYMTPATFDLACQRESVDYDASRAAVLNGNTVAGLCMLGIRGRRGYVFGMGVVPEFRKRGIARQIIASLIGESRQRGLTQIQLEVITRNSPACHLYQAVGFKTRRELAVLKRECVTVPAELPGMGYTVEKASPEAASQLRETFHAPDLVWQRETAASRPEEMAIIARNDGGMIAGYCLYAIMGSHGIIHDFAGNTSNAGNALMHYLLYYYPDTTFHYQNVDTSDPMISILYEMGFENMISQYEMILPLNEENG